MTGARRSATAALLALAAVPALALASDGGSATAFTFFWIGLLLLLAKMAGTIERLGQPAVLGELLVGVAIGNLYLSPTSPAAKSCAFSPSSAW